MKKLVEVVIVNAGNVDANDKKKIGAIAAEIRQRHAGAFTRLERLRSHYVTRYRMWKILADERQQTSRAITIDHLKLYFSRLVYALTIAAVVLMTGYFAKVLDIPLPMFRAVVP